MIGAPSTESISFAVPRVIGAIRVPKPAAGITAVVTVVRVTGHSGGGTAQATAKSKGAPGRRLYHVQPCNSGASPAQTACLTLSRLVVAGTTDLQPASPRPHDPARAP